jgi:hypothetical protein
MDFEGEESNEYTPSKQNGDFDNLHDDIGDDEAKIPYEDFQEFDIMKHIE